jgi:hypothetical protein
MKYNKIVAVSIITVGLLFLASIQGIFNAAAVKPDWLPANVSINGYSEVYSDNISVNSFRSNSSQSNVTCYLQLWSKNSTNNQSNLIGSAMLDKGGKLFSQAINLTNVTGFRLLIIKGLTGLNDTELAAIDTVWKLMVAILKGQSSLNVTEPTISNVDRAVQIESNSSFFNYIILSTKGDYTIIVFNFDASQQWVDWISTANKTEITSRFKVVVFGFYGMLSIFLSVVTLLVADSSIFSSNPTATPMSGSISPSAGVTMTELQAFIQSWGDVLESTGKLPGYEIAILMVATALGAGIVARKIKRSRKD